MKTSIVLCTYNGEAYLQQQLDSYLAQSQLPNELVVFDDGSTDQSLSILEHFSSSAPFKVSIHRNENRLGSAVNFIHCLLAASGDLIFFSDHDDIWSPDKIATFVDQYKNHSDSKLLLSNANLIDENNSVIQHNFLKSIDFYHRWNQDSMFDLMRKNYGFLNGFLLCVHKDVQQLVKAHLQQFLAKPMGHDHFIGLLVAATYSKKQVRLIDQELVSYRQHQSQVIGAKSSKIGQQRIDELATQKKEEKANHLVTHLQYLKKCISLLPRHEQITFSNTKAFYERRIQNSNKNILSKFFFALQSMINGQYKKHCQYPIKEAIRDIL